MRPAGSSGLLSKAGPGHHNASMQIFADGEDTSRVVWIADLLPIELANPIGAMIEQGLGAMKRKLEA